MAKNQTPRYWMTYLIQEGKEIRSKVKEGKQPIRNVMDFLLENQSYGNICYATSGKIAKELGIARQNVWKALRHLCQCKAVVPYVPKGTKRSTGYVINPFVWGCVNPKGPDTIDGLRDKWLQLMKKEP